MFLDEDAKRGAVICYIYPYFSFLLTMKFNSVFVQQSKMLLHLFILMHTHEFIEDILYASLASLDEVTDLALISIARCCLLCS